MKKKIAVAAVLLLAVLLVCAGCANDSSVKLSGNYRASDGDYFNFTVVNGQDYASYLYTTSTSPLVREMSAARYSVSGSTVTVNLNPPVQLTLSNDNNTLTDTNGKVFTKQ